MAWTLISSNSENRILYGVNTHIGSDAAYSNETGVIDEVASLGFNSHRDSVFWSHFEVVNGVYTMNPTGDADSQALYNAWARNASQGYDLHTVFGCQWDNTNHGGPSDATYRDAFCDAYQYVAEQYIAAGYNPSKLTMELWNEPTITTFSARFDTAAEADEMSLLQLDFYDRIKGVNPDITVTGPASLDSFWLWGNGAWPQGFWATSGWSTHMDAWSDHIYLTGGADHYPEYLYNRNTSDVGIIFYENRLQAGAISDGGKRIRYDITEFGYDTTTFTDATITKWLPRAFALYSTFRDTSGCWAYELLNSAGTFGLSTTLGNRKTQATAVSDILPHLKLATQRHYFRTSTYNAGHHAVLLVCPDGQRLVVWTLAGDTSVDIAVKAIDFPGTLSIQIIGSTTSTQALTVGANTATVTLTDTAKVLYANVPIEFTEFSILSVIDLTVPPQGHAYTAPVRTNFTSTDTRLGDLERDQIMVSSIMPTSGTYSAGQFVRCNDTVERGAANSKYVVIGWLRLRNGYNHVLDTDWRELRALTGN